MKKIVRVFAVILAIAMMVSVFGGCHKKGEIAYTIGGREFTSSMYSCVLYTAASSARNAIYSFISENSGDTSNINYNEYKFDADGVVSPTGTTSYTDFVEGQALRVLRQYAAVLNMMEEKGLELDEETKEYAELQASYYWYIGCSYTDYVNYTNSGYDVSQYFTPYYYFFEPNGVAYETYELYMTYELSYNYFFYELYGEGGEKAISETDLFAYFDEHYAVADSFAYALADDEGTAISDDEKAVLSAEANAFAERLNGGESFDTIYKEFLAAEEAREKAKEEAEKEESEGESESETETETEGEGTTEEDKTENTTENTTEDTKEDTAEDTDEEESDEYEPEDYTSIFGDADSDYASDHFEKVHALEIGKATVIEDTTNKVLIVVSRRDSHEEDGYWLDFSGNAGVMRDSIIYNLKNEEYDNWLTEVGNTYDAVADKHALRPFDVKDLVFDIEE